MTNFFSICETGFGDITVLWSEYKNQLKIFRILNPNPSQSVKKSLSLLFPDAIERNCSEIDEQIQLLKASISGEKVKFSLKKLRMDLCSNFQQKVLYATFEIPVGCVATYQSVARHIKIPKGSRAVGNALAANLFPIIIPCHRVIRSDNTLGGYTGGIGIEMKQSLLSAEGIKFTKKGLVTTKDFYY